MLALDFSLCCSLMCGFPSLLDIADIQIKSLPRWICMDGVLLIAVIGSDVHFMSWSTRHVAKGLRLIVSEASELISMRRSHCNLQFPLSTKAVYGVLGQNW